MCIVVKSIHPMVDKTTWEFEDSKRPCKYHQEQKHLEKVATQLGRL